MVHFQDQRQEADEGVEELPDGICVSRFGPISRSKDAAMRRQGSEPRAVTANIGQVRRFNNSSIIEHSKLLEQSYYVCW